MTAPAHERLWRQVLNDPAATNEQRMQAAKRLEKSVLERKKLRTKARKEVEAEEQAAEAAESQNDPGDWSFLGECRVQGCKNPHSYGGWCREHVPVIGCGYCGKTPTRRTVPGGINYCDKHPVLGAGLAFEPPTPLRFEPIPSN